MQCTIPPITSAMSAVCALRSDELAISTKMQAADAAECQHAVVLIGAAARYETCLT